MGMAYKKMVELAVNNPEETRGLLKSYLDFSGTEEERQKRIIDQLERACFRLMQKLAVVSKDT